MSSKRKLRDGDLAFALSRAAEIVAMLAVVIAMFLFLNLDGRSLLQVFDWLAPD